MQDRGAGAVGLERLRRGGAVERLRLALQAGDDDIGDGRDEAPAAGFGQAQGQRVEAVDAAVGLRIEQAADRLGFGGLPHRRVQRLEQTVDLRIGRTVEHVLHAAEQCRRVERFDGLRGRSARLHQGEGEQDGREKAHATGRRRERGSLGRAL